ncbi:glycine-rich domain-containing protein [Thalassospira lucentensis]|uniref:glycine-rich domain-containing protein n=1 Tax=Thalassospira lucentensis TaxID=168935 RepID=UPI00142E1795|nr:hypothetical protein [Thalassospira lucentensis]NIZ02643.1 hypothetical protein [Thalassospira lucentensis]
MNAALAEALTKCTQIVAGLDFNLQKRKMVEVQGWTQEAVDIMENEYRKFLALSAALEVTQDETVVVPNRTIDLFWHAHIMDTEKYHNDCDAVFGHYLHHFPYFGMQDSADTQNWQNCSSNANALWEEAFGDPLYEEHTNEDAYQLDKKWATDLSKSIVVSAMSPPKRCMRKNCKPQKCR